MLTGRRLFHGESQEATLAQVLAGDVAPPSSIVSDIPRALDAVVLRGLARTPASRFPTAKAMAQALKSCCKLESDNEVAAWLNGSQKSGFKRELTALLAWSATSTPAKSRSCATCSAKLQIQSVNSTNVPRKSDNHRHRAGAMNQSTASP